jgi:hypothetical protein
VPVIAVVLFVLLGVTVLIPISIIQRFRMGTARRPARRWVATLNLFGVIASVVLLLVAALITSRWAPEAFRYTLVGLTVGSVLGGLGIVLTRWEYRDAQLQYTPNRWLVLMVTMAVALRMAYGFYRGWEAWRTSLESMTWVAASGVAGSMAAGAAVLGYYLVFWAGIRRRIRRAASRRPPHVGW